jgi:CubicO group peptidase (beta-lactamase class C family)
MIKSMTAMLAASIVDSGLIGWDSTVAGVLPDLTGIRSEYAAVTLDDLLRHRAGVIPMQDSADVAAVPPLTGTLPEQRLQFTAWALSQPPALPPRTASEYTNAGYVIAAAMLERVTGRGYEELLTTRILRPLGIDSVFGWPARNGAPQPWGHTVAGGIRVPNDPDDPNNYFPAPLTPAGNISLTMTEYVRYVQVHMQALQGHPTLVSGAGFARLHSLVEGYGLGWLQGMANGKEIIGHNGSAGTFYTFVIVERDGAKGVVVMANAESDSIDAAVVNLVLQLHNAF